MLRVQDLEQDEIHSLATCNGASEIVAIQLNGKGKPRIVTIARMEITTWQLVLKFFHLGKFAKTEIRLEKVVRHLNEYYWGDAALEHGDSELYRAYLRVCIIANAALACKGNTTLYSNVSLKVIEAPVLKKGCPHDSYLVKWNPMLKYKHIVASAQNIYKNVVKISIESPAYKAIPEEESPIPEDRPEYLNINLCKGVHFVNRGSSVYYD